MRISVFGLGYVGAVSAACLAADGHTVVGVDTNQVKVDLLNQGRAPVIEEGLGELIEQGVTSGRLRATTDCDEAVATTDLGFVCVGTPSKGNGSLDLAYLRRVADDIGQAIGRQQTDFTVVIRSTVLPGTTRQVVLPDLERAAGRPVAVGVHPEFLREGTAIRDYNEPPKVVVGADDPRVQELVAQVADRPGAPLIQIDLELAEMVKYADNAWHALKVTFANEIGSLAKAQGLDGQRVMDIFCADTKLNLSPVYLRPGFAFGGSCLPKDVRALRYQGRSLDLDLPVLNAILPSSSTGRSSWSPRPAPAGWGCWAWPSRPAPTTCARAPWSRSWSGSSARATTSASTTPTSAWPSWWGPTRATSSTRSPTSPT